MTIEQYIEQAILPQYDAFDGGHKRNQQGLENLRAIIRDESRLRALCEKYRSL